MKSGFRWVSLIIGTTIGAGYASGRELWEFFGHESGLAILLFMIFFTISCNVIMHISYKHQTTDYRPVLRAIVGNKLAVIYDIMLFIYLFTTTVVMLSGSGATGQAFNFSYWWGLWLIVLAVIVLFIKGIDGLLSLNQLVLPILIIGLVTILLSFTYQQELSLFSHWGAQRNWLAAFPFTALNILPLIAVLGAVGYQMKSKREIWFASIASSIILGVVSYLYNNSLIQIADELFIYEIPLFAILKNYPYEMFIFMSILLWFAIYTTAAAGTLGIVTRLKGYFNLPLWVLVTCVLLTMIPLTFIGFSTLISFTYPLYGLLNLYVLTRLLLFPIWQHTKKQ